VLAQATTAAHPTPGLLWVWPFAALLLAIAILPLIPRAEKWWHHNRNKLLVALSLAGITCGYYLLRGYGVVHDDGHATQPGLQTVLSVLQHAVADEFVPFMTLLLGLYVIAGGIVVRGDVRATPLTNTTILGVGAVLASLIGTTGASMVLIRFLLRTNRERKFVVHSVVFFIFIVSNCGGLLLPTGDPPLFLGYLRGVPFFWTLQLWKEWILVVGLLLAIYFIWDSWAYRHERPAEIAADIAQVEPLRIAGGLNFAWLLLLVAAVATLDPAVAVPGTTWHAPRFLREGVVIGLALIGLASTPAALRKENQFNYTAILEVACLFIGIFITMQTPLEILHARGAELGVTQPWQFFWATGALSSFLDNAPTYVVFLELAKTQTPAAGAGILDLIGGGHVRESLLLAISTAAVFMGANTYIGNGPNFMVKAIAEQSGVKMPSFFGYMLYSGLVLIPLFVLTTWLLF
jgi:Na+/H+ antiporter NhaD/arsenite permease-like protein